MTTPSSGFQLIMLDEREAEVRITKGLTDFHDLHQEMEIQICRTTESFEIVKTEQLFACFYLRCTLSLKNLCVVPTLSYQNFVDIISFVKS